MARQSEMMRLRLSLLVPNRIEQEVDKNILGHLALHVQYAHLYIHTFHFPLVTINELNFTRMCIARLFCAGPKCMLLLCLTNLVLSILMCS